MKRNALKMSLVTAMLIGSSAFAGQIVTDADISDYNNTVIVPNQQFGFGGWNLENVLVKIVSTEDYSTALPGTNFNETTGEYSDMTDGMSFESEISDSTGTVMGLLHGKDWPVGEPAGIKIINGDTAVKNGKPENCIINTSYIGEDLKDGESHFLDDTKPLPVICSSPFQTHKRFKVNFQPATVATVDAEGYGKSVDLVFNLEPGQTDKQRYQVFQKINNYTGARLDGYKIEVLDENGSKNPELTISLGIGENGGSDIWGPEEMANFSHGLWGPQEPPHFPDQGFFDNERAYFPVNVSTDKSTIFTTHGAVKSNVVDTGDYDNLFGHWLPSVWAPTGIFFDHDNDPKTDAELVAFFGDPDGDGTDEWHKGDVDNFAEPSLSDWAVWSTSSQYSEGVIEDTLNLGINYIVEVGDNDIIGSKITIRITPHKSSDQTPPTYVNAEDPLDPTSPYPYSTGVVIISPFPTFDIGTTLDVIVADADLNDPTVIDILDIEVKNETTGEVETIKLTESSADSGKFAGLLPTVEGTIVVNDGNMSVSSGEVLTATYIDERYGTADKVEVLTASTTAVTPPSVPNPSSGGGGCTYNPNSKSFDIMFLVMMALGLLYPFRRRFIK